MSRNMLHNWTSDALQVRSRRLGRETLQRALSHRPHLKPTNDSWRVDEIYIKVKGKNRYLYRTVDSKGSLQRSQDAQAVKRFFRKALKAAHHQKPRVINVDKNAAYPKAIDEIKASVELPLGVELRQNKYLNNLVELSASGN